MSKIKSIAKRFFGDLHLVLEDGKEIILGRGTHEKEQYQVGDEYPKPVQPTASEPVAPVEAAPAANPAAETTEETKSETLGNA